jgi:ComF family protein
MLSCFLNLRIFTFQINFYIVSGKTLKLILHSLSVEAGYLVNLFYPMLCSGCGEFLLRNEKEICTRCQYHLPRTNHHHQPDNKVAKLFWGRVNILNATSFVHFQKGGIVQNMMHQLKYKGRKETGYQLGILFGIELLSSPLYATIDVVIPVPLHASRLAKRGYNQAEWIARGISESMNKDFGGRYLRRIRNNPTQTKKGRFERFENVQTVFEVAHPEEIIGRHVLLVDDVVTTGSTLEACANQLLEAGICRISIATLAIA